MNKKQKAHMKAEPAAQVDDNRHLRSCNELMTRLSLPEIVSWARNANRVLLGLCTIITLTGCARGLEPSIDRWAQSGGASWEIRKGVITGTGTDDPGFLVSPLVYETFDLTVEFKPDGDVNSGILIQCHDPTNLQIDNCYEINIWDDHPDQQYRTGAIVLHASPPLVALDTVGQWNRYRISASPSRVSVWLNGTLTAQLDDPVQKDGYIALQSVNGVVKFRRLKITPASPYKPTINSGRDQ